jgi:methyl-accepting chemotaxis protein
MKGKFKSLKVVLSSIVVAIIVVLIVFLIAMSYQTAYNAVERSYLNQLDNFNNDINRQMENFYTAQLKNAEMLAENQLIINAILKSDYSDAAPLLKGFYDKLGIYENVFISTIEDNPRLLASGSG